jgi:hypothetical protein
MKTRLTGIVAAIILLGVSVGASAITAEEKQILAEIRNNVFGGARLSAAFEQSTLSGAEPMIFPYEVADRGLIVWEIHEEYAASFAQEIGLAPPFALSRISPLTVKGSQTYAARFKRFLEERGLDRLLAQLYPERYYVIADIGITQRAEVGPKLEFKTFVQVAGDPTPRLYRFGSYKAIPGVELLELASNAPAALEVSATPRSWDGALYADQGGLAWSVPVRSAHKRKAKVTGNTRFSEAFLDAGEQVFGPRGVSARYFYDGSSVSGGFLPVKERKVRVENTFTWAQYLKQGADVLLLDTLSEFLVEPVTAPVQVTTGGPGVCGAPAADASQLFANLAGCALAGVEPETVFGLLFQNAATIAPQEFPTVYWALLDLYQGLGIFQGTEKPKLFFSLLENPQTLFINFEIPRAKVKAFEKAFLPDNFKLAKIRFYPEQRRAVYAVSLNVYESVGQNISGFRAEWSTYVINPAEEDPKPRFSVLEAQTNVGGFDAVTALERYVPGLDLSSPAGLLQLIEPPSDEFEYVANEAAGIQLRVRDIEEQIEVDVSIAYPPARRILHTNPTTDWMEANDFVYWGEVADILKYSRKVMFADLLVFDARSSDIIRDSTFADYVKPEPLPIIIWNGGQDIALEPWGNLDAIEPND